MNKKGIDISFNQRNVDFTKVKKAGYDFVIIRAGYGRFASQVDAQFEKHYKGAKDAGLGVGCYWYSYADSTERAKEEAQACLEVIKGKQFDYPVYYDVEERVTFGKGKATVSAIITAFCEKMEKAGYYTGLYMSKSHLQDYVTDTVKKAYTLWVAQYYSACTYKGAGAVDMWQKASDGKVSGVSGNTDIDECYKDFPAIIKGGGFNGYKKAPQKTYHIQVGTFSEKTDAQNTLKKLEKAGFSGIIVEGK